MNKVGLFLIVMALAAAGCQSSPTPAAPATAAPAAAVMPTAAPSPAATVVAPTLPAMPGSGVKPALDKNFRDPAEPWCQGGSYDYGDFFCQDGEYHLIAKGDSIATWHGGDFKNFILQAQMRLTGEEGVFLGIYVDLLTPEVAASEGITGTVGALIRSVVAGGSAAEAGLTTGDVITAVNGEPVDASHGLRSRMAGYQPNDEITVTVVKGANGPAAPHDVKVKLQGRPPEQWYGAYGVVFRGSGSRFYIFMVHPNGEFQLITWSPDPNAVQTVIPWAKSAAIQPGPAVNLLAVIAQDSNLTLMINNQQVASVRDDTFKEGEAGPVVLEEGHAAVSAFKVWELP